MIKISLYKDRNNFCKIVIEGHAGIKGSSIPCAALSYLVQSIDSFMHTKQNSISYDDGKIYKIDLKKLKKYSEDLFEFLIFSLFLLERDYPSDIKIELMEEIDGT